MLIDFSTTNLIFGKTQKQNCVHQVCSICLDNRLFSTPVSLWVEILHFILPFVSIGFVLGHLRISTLESKFCTLRVGYESVGSGSSILIGCFHFSFQCVMKFRRVLDQQDLQFGRLISRNILLKPEQTLGAKCWLG